jgi:hypothetical protein
MVPIDRQPKKELPALDGLLITPLHFLSLHQRLFSACALVGLPLSLPNGYAICLDFAEQV